MARERAYEGIDPVAFTADGQTGGIVTIEDTFCFKVKMVVVIDAVGFEAKSFQVKRVLSETQMILGEIGKPLTDRSDVTAYVLGISPTVKAHEQDRPNISDIDYERAVYEEEPTVAKRVFNVDKYGHPYTTENPFPVDVIFNIDTIEFTNPNDQQFIKIPITTKATEVSFTFPDNTKYYQIKARKNKDVIKVGLSAGAIAAGNYWEIPFGNGFSPEELVNFPSGYTLYFESKHNDNVDLEIFYYRKL